MVAIVEDDTAMRGRSSDCCRRAATRLPHLRRRKNFWSERSSSKRSDWSSTSRLVLDIHFGGMSGIELCDVLLTKRVNRSFGFGFGGAYGLVKDDPRYQYVINGRVTFYF
jgi:hypothetical protein